MAIILLVVMYGCGIKGTVYVIPGKNLQYQPDLSASAKIQIQPFNEQFSNNEVVGELLTKSGNYSVNIKKQMVSKALHEMVSQALVRQDMDFFYGKAWDKSMASLGQYQAVAQVVVAGRISKLQLNVEPKLTHTVYRVDSEIECVFGLPREQKIITRRVLVSQELIKFSTKTEIIEQLLDEVLAEAAKSVAAKTQEVVDNEL